MKTSERAEAVVGDQRTFTGKLQADVETIREALQASGDLAVREITLPGGVAAAILYVRHLTDAHALAESILRPLLHPAQPPPAGTGEAVMDWARRRALAVGEVETIATPAGAAEALAAGESVLLVAGACQALAMDSRGWPARPPEEPRTEVLIRGPREGFTETLSDNVAMVRRRIRDSRLAVREFALGTVTRSRVAVLYLDGITPKPLLREVFGRLQQIRTDGVLESGYVEQFIEDHPRALFPQVLHTERPDRVAAALLEGRVAILVDGTPFGLVLPATVFLFLQSPEDYYERPVLVVLSRLVRITAVIVATVLPAAYVSFTSFHPEMVPTELAITLAAGQIRLPFPVAAEALLMEIFLELLLEGSVRLPAAVGPTVGIVGALIIGEMAVRAGIVGPVMAIIIAVTALASYAIPAYVLGFSVKIIRVGLLLLASAFGLIGVMTGVNLLFTHMASLESFGVPYLSPLAPANREEMKDLVVRTFLWRMKTRPDSLGVPNRRRQPSPASRFERRGGGRQP